LMRHDEVTLRRGRADALLSHITHNI
jgi:hypothetical protein